MTSETTFDRLRRIAPTISVGMLTADLGNLNAELQRIEGVGVEVVHFDVMDGVFCPMSTIGPPVVDAVRTNMLKDVHLMVEEPLAKLDAYVKAGADVVTLHVESSRYVQPALQRLGTLKNVNDEARGIVRGIALNPGTPLDVLDPLLDDVEFVLLLAVNPGFPGGFVPSTPARFAALQTKVRRHGRDVLLGIDGGVKRANIADIVALGPDLIVTGSAVFDGVAPEENARSMLDAMRFASRSGS